jgi:hypothetical protein
MSDRTFLLPAFVDQPVVELCVERVAMEFFSSRQRDVIGQILTTGAVRKSQVAILLPRLVDYVFQNESSLRDSLVRTYGPRVTDVLEGLGSALLAGDPQARTVFELMVSKTRKDN